MELEVKLEVFEGPLDLLLHLIEKNKVDIYDIPIVEITRQYLEYVSKLAEENLDLASEFLVMASTLIDIKCKMLLPKEVDEDGEEIDPRADLVQKLIEYKMYKYAAIELKDMQLYAGKSLYKEPTIPEEVAKYQPPVDLDEILKDVDLNKLKEIFDTVIKRQIDKIDPVRSKFGKIEMEEVSLTDKITYVKKVAVKKHKCSFKQLLENQTSKMEVIVTFLAVLELIKVGEINVSQEKTFDEEKPYELCIYRQLLDKPISVDIDVLSTYGIEKIISYHGNNCAIQIGSDYSPVTYIGTILINKFISEISVNIGTDLYNFIEQSTDDTYITNLGVSGKYIYYMKVNAEDESEQVIVYDSESNSKRIRINYNINEKSRIEKIFLVGGEPIVITNANGEYKIVNLGTQSELMELKKGDEVLYIDDTFIVMNEYVRKFFWQKYTEMVTVYRYPGIYEDDKRILMENRRFFDYIQNSDELLILLEEERDGELKRTEEESEKTGK